MPDLTQMRQLRNHYTKILDKTSPGIYPARTGTNAVANDQVKTPSARTCLY